MKNVVLILFLFSCPDVCCQPVHAQDVDIRRQTGPVLQPRCCMCRGEDVQVVAGPLPIGQSFAAADSLKVPEDPSPDALKCLQGLCYGPAEFSVRCEPSTAGAGDCLLRFPSAKPTGLPQNDEVVVEWYAVTSKTGEAVCAPAVIVVHESGRGMTVGRMMARGFRDRGLHALMVQLPFYGLRRPPGERAEDHGFAVVMGQGIADVRRALDAVRALPAIAGHDVSLQGTSLGGFVAATTAGLDSAFQNVFVLLAGGNLPELVRTGQRETAELRKMLERQGFSGDAMIQLLNRFEPNRLAHRIPADRLWLYSAMFDTVVPPAHCDAFAKAAGLADEHVIRMPASHYSGLIFLPSILDQMAVECGGRALMPGLAAQLKPVALPDDSQSGKP